MSSENTSDNARKLDDFENLKDIILHKEEDQSIPVEYFVSENFLVPGVITEYFDKQLLFKPYLSDEIFHVSYNEIRHPSNEAIHCTYEVGKKVEVYMLDANLNLHGWAKSTITSSVKDTHVVKLEKSNAFVVVEGDKIRTIATDAYLNNRHLYTFNIPVPQELQNFASSIKVHDIFRKAIGNPHISYDFEENALVIRSNNVGCANIAKMLLSTHFENLTEKMLLTESINKLGVKFQTIKTDDLLEQFQVHPDLLKYVIGNNGINIQRAEMIPGVTYVAVLSDLNTVKIYGQNKTAIKEACDFLQLEKEIIKISSEMVGKIIRKSGQNIQDIADQSNIHHIVITKNENLALGVTEFELIGTSSSIAAAKCVLQYHICHIWGFDKMVQVFGDVNNENNTVFGDESAKSSSESAAEGNFSDNLTQRVITGRNFSDNINEASRGRAGISLRGGSNVSGRSRGRFRNQFTQTRVSDYEGQNATNQTAQQFPQSTTSRDRSRGRGRRLALAPIRDVNSISSRPSLNDSFINEYRHFWIGRRWQNRALNMPTWNDLEELHFGNSSTNNSSDATGDDSAALEDDQEREI